VTQAQARRPVQSPGTFVRRQAAASHGRMKTRIAALAVLAALALPGAASAETCRPNIIGGVDCSGGLRTRPNIHGGQDYSNGLKSRPNIFGGQDFTDGTRCTPNIFGGMDCRKR